MKFEKWNLPAAAPAVAELEQAGYPALLSAVLAAHGITDDAAARAFLQIDGRLGITATTLEGILTVKGQGRR